MRLLLLELLIVLVALDRLIVPIINETTTEV